MQPGEGKLIHVSVQREPNHNRPKGRPDWNVTLRVGLYTTVVLNEEQMLMLSSALNHIRQAWFEECTRHTHSQDRTARRTLAPAAGK